MWFCCLAVFVLGASHFSLASHFWNPSTPTAQLNFLGNAEWAIGETHLVDWTSTNDTYNVSLWQQSLTQGSGVLLTDAYAASNTRPGNHSFNWTVQLHGADLSYSNVFFWWIEADDHKSSIASSAYFNITDQPVASTSSSSATSSPTGTPPSSASNSAASTTGAAASAASAKASSASPSPNNKDALKVGLGVGLGLGIPLLLLMGAGVAFLFMRLKRRPKDNTPHEPKIDYGADSHPSEPSVSPYHYDKPLATSPVVHHELPDQSPAAHEISGLGSTAELPGGNEDAMGKR